MRQILIWKEQPSEFLSLSNPRLRSRKAQASAIFLTGPIFETDLLLDRLAGRLDLSGVAWWIRSGWIRRCGGPETFLLIPS